MNELSKGNIYSRVTDKIIADLEKGTRPWMKPWNSNHPSCGVQIPLRHNGTPYRGINIVLLWIEAMDKGYQSQIWMTYKQATELGAQVRKGEKGSLVVYADSMTKTETDDSGEEKERLIPFMKGYTVFNTDQIDGLPEQYQIKPQSNQSPRIAEADRFFAETGATIKLGGDKAYYTPSGDYIQMPPFEAFRDAESYIATLAHETVHWTSHKTRLDRSFENGNQFGSTSYAKEELVAEIGAAFLCAGLNITPEIPEDHAAYISHWLKALKQDSRFIFTAASHAQKAADYLHSLQAHKREAT